MNAADRNRMNGSCVKFPKNIFNLQIEKIRKYVKEKMYSNCERSKRN
jgi:hypothetical protein